MPPTEDYRFGEVIPKSSSNAALTVAADANKQYAITYVSIKGDGAGMAELKIGTTVVWRGRNAADCADGQNFGEKGIKNGIAKNEGVSLAYTGTPPTNYELNFGLKEIYQVT
jgi:hypothetical protein